MRTHEIFVGEGIHRVELFFRDTGAGWVGSLTGGESSHVGGIVLAVPRSSLTGSGRSCDMWIVPVPGHLDNKVAEPIAREICLETGVAVSLTAGIHIHAASREDISTVTKNCEKACRIFLQACRASTLTK
jgi:hypothetical protein